MIASAVERSAELSPCGRYRYRLGRRWGFGSCATFVMLNPSTADADVDDPTIRRCVAFARSWGCGRLLVVNLFGWRATDPAALGRVDDPVGPNTDRRLSWAALSASASGGPVVAAWGAHPAARSRVAAVLRLDGLSRLQCLGVTKDGAPRHPLYLRRDAALVPWPLVGAA